MAEILEYITNNYTLFLIILILILLAVIGKFADKTDFGKKKFEFKKRKNKKASNGEEENKEVIEQIEPASTMEEPIIDSKPSIDETEGKAELISTPEEPIIDSKPFINEIEEKDESINTPEEPIIEENNKDDEKESELKKFDEEFNNLLPKKDIIDEELLEDIDNLSLDKTQKFTFKDIPDLDDVELPKIKSLSDDSDDIWKF